MKLKVVSVSNSNKIQESLAEEYFKRLKHYCSMENISIKPRKLSDEAAQIKSDSKQITDVLKTEDYLILLDERGKNFSSVDFSKWISQLQQKNKSVAFLIGGAFGVDETIEEKAAFKLSLSAMTLPHQLAKIFLLEQLYRAFTILNRQPYHHA